MDKDLLKAVLVILRYCLEQKNCKTCPLKDICGKLPSEW